MILYQIVSVFLSKSKFLSAKSKQFSSRKKSILSIQNAIKMLSGRYFLPNQFKYIIKSVQRP